jgi:hypothetical protein
MPKCSECKRECGFVNLAEFKSWLQQTFTELSEEDVKKIVHEVRLMIDDAIGEMILRAIDGLREKYGKLPLGDE